MTCSITSGAFSRVQRLELSACCAVLCIARCAWHYWSWNLIWGMPRHRDTAWNIGLVSARAHCCIIATGPFEIFSAPASVDSRLITWTEWSGLKKPDGRYHANLSPHQMIRVGRALTACGLLDRGVMAEEMLIVFEPWPTRCWLAT